MTKVIRTCDRCKKEVQNKEDLNTLKLVFTNPRNYSYASSKYTETQSTIPEVEWCKLCCEESGFARYQTSEIKTTVPTFEEMLQEMVSTAVQEAVNQTKG